jgi:hypothetical protein
MLGTYQGVPPFLNPSFSAQVCVVSSKGTDIGDKTPITESPPHIKVPPVEEILPQEFPESATAPLITDPPPLQGKIPVWETVPQAITQIPFFYPPPGVEAFQVAAMLTLPNMVLTIPVWYLHPPRMVPQPSLPQSEGIPMQIPVLTLTMPPSPPIASTTATAGGRWKKKDPIAPLPPRVQLPCALCERKGHPTHKCPSLPELRSFIQLPQAPLFLATPPSMSHTTMESSTTCKQNIRTNFACAICAEYGHYTHHFPSIPYVCHTLAVERHTYLPELPPTLHTNAPVNVIHYISSSILEQRGGPCPPTKLPPIAHSVSATGMALWAHRPYLIPFPHFHFLVQEPISSIFRTIFGHLHSHFPRVIIFTFPRWSIFP